MHCFKKIILQWPLLKVKKIWTTQGLYEIFYYIIITCYCYLLPCLAVSSTPGQNIIENSVPSPATHPIPSPVPNEESTWAQRLEIFVSCLESLVSCVVDVVSLFCFIFSGDSEIRFYNICGCALIYENLISFKIKTSKAKQLGAEYLYNKSIVEISFGQLL